MMDSFTPKGPKEYLSIIGGAFPTLDMSGHLSNFPVSLKVVVMITLLQMTFEQPKALHQVGSNRDALMVRGTKTHANTPCYNR